MTRSAPTRVCVCAYCTICMVHHKSHIVYATENPNIIIHVLKRTMLLTSNCVSVRCCIFAPLQRQHEECSIDTVTAGGLVQSFDNDSTE